MMPRVTNTNTRVSPGKSPKAPSLPFSCKSMHMSLSHSFKHLSFICPKPTSILISPNTIRLSNPSPATMDSSSSSSSIHQIPDLKSHEIDSFTAEIFRRYASTTEVKRSGSGVAIVWFRNDLRVLDNEALCRAWASSEAVLPLYCIDPRLFGTTHHFGFPKTGALRAQFLIECLSDLRKNLLKLGLNLLIRHGKPEDIIPSIAKAFGAHTVYAHKETCSEELAVEHFVSKGLQRVVLPPGGPNDRSSTNPKLQLLWGNTLYHLDDLPFSTGSLPDVYTQFRKKPADPSQHKISAKFIFEETHVQAVESKCRVRSCYKLPTPLGPLPSIGLDEIGGWGCIPSLDQLGFPEEKWQHDRGMCFIGGESAALGRVHEYFWKKDLLRVYKETRNGMLGPDYSTKFSPWLASGSLSPRYVNEEVKRYEKERIVNDSTYWVLFELIWRDYFRFLSMKYRNSIFHLGGPRKIKDVKWSQDQALFEAWRDGRTGYPLIDANMKELSATGFMSNRGRQIVCSFLVRDMGIDWRMGAEWFETCLLDYDPCSNYGNWTYGAGVGNDPREDRYFSIPKQAQTYDPEGKYVAYWLPELQMLPRDKRNFPGDSYIKQIVPLKFGNTSQRYGHGNVQKGKQKQVYRK